MKERGWGRARAREDRDARQTGRQMSERARASLGTKMAREQRVELVSAEISERRNQRAPTSVSVEISERRISERRNQ